MACIKLIFSDTALVKIEFRHYGAVRKAIRGKYSLSSSATFQLTKAVDGLVRLCLMTLLDESYTDPDRSLYFAMLKRAQWYVDIFGDWRICYLAGGVVALKPIDIEVLSTQGELISPRFYKRLLQRLPWSESPVPSPLDHTDLKEGIGEPSVEAPIVICETDLVVTKAFTAVWGIEEELGRIGLNVAERAWDWSDSILESIDSGALDIAIYNRSRTERYLESRKHSSVKLLTEIGRSMGGKNFYILASEKGSWPRDLTLEQIRLNIAAGAVTLAVPISSDMYQNFFDVVGYSEEKYRASGSRVINVPVTQGLEVFEFDPNILLIHGQNIRKRALYRGGFFEVLPFDSLPPTTKKLLMYRSVNVVVCSSRFVELLGAERIATLFAEIKHRVRRHFLDPSLCEKLVSNLSNDLSYRSASKMSEDEFVVASILYETYGAAIPHLPLSM
jgi:hypothetical protein